MPRKLIDHFHILSLFLFEKLPKKWKMESLSNLDEKKLFLKLCKSKIFLSFSYAEGFGMPPLEAAIAGNKVIGYTGGGGKEYWQKPIFEEIQSGDIKKFSEKILDAVNDDESSPADANGSEYNFVIGGTSDAITYDYDEAELSLFINDRLFKDGGITDANPILHADVLDCQHPSIS